MLISYTTIFVRHVDDVSLWPFPALSLATLFKLMADRINLLMWLDAGTFDDLGIR